MVFPHKIPGTCVPTATVICRTGGSGGVGGMAGIVLGVPEQQRDAPQSCQPHQRVDNPGEERHLPAEEESHRVKAEQPDTAPVQCADNHKNQRDFVNDHVDTSYDDWTAHSLPRNPESIHGLQDGEICTIIIPSNHRAGAALTVDSKSDAVPASSKF